ncbi:MAG: hypothetical protein JSS74_09955 [Actinobacteria bacterium]|nr:hypothetical protein [Actinomycetota bacterium]
MSDAGILRFDTAELTATVPAGAAKAEGDERLRAEIGAHAGAKVTAGPVIRSVVLVVGAGLLSYFFLVILQMTITLFTHARTNGALLLPTAIVMVLPLLVARIRALTAVRRDADRRWYLLSRFAQRNGLGYRLREEDPDEPAQLFGIGSARIATDIVTGSAARPFAAANYDYETWAARTRMPRSAAYASFTVRNPLPAFAILARDAPGGMPSWQPRADQQEIAEIDARVRVFCAPPDEPAVRALLTTETLADLVAVAGDVDVESTGSKIFFIARDRVSVEDPAFWEWIEDLAALLDRRLDAQPVGPAEPAPSDPAPADPARTARRRALFRPSGAGRSFVIGCLLPLVFGVVVVLIGMSMG